MSDKGRALTFAISIVIGGIALGLHIAGVSIARDALMPVFVVALTIAIFCRLPIWKKEDGKNAK
jgi:ABC-type nitrate/sulfonate/bicarbonate transport system permease component